MVDNILITTTRCEDDDDDDDDESISYVRPLLQLQTVTNVLIICSDEQFSFQIVTYDMMKRLNYGKNYEKIKTCH